MNFVSSTLSHLPTMLSLTMSTASCFTPPPSPASPQFHGGESIRFRIAHGSGAACRKLYPLARTDEDDAAALEPRVERSTRLSQASPWRRSRQYRVSADGRDVGSLAPS